MTFRDLIVLCRNAFGRYTTAALEDRLDSLLGVHFEGIVEVLDVTSSAVEVSTLANDSISEWTVDNWCEGINVFYDVGSFRDSLEDIQRGDGVVIAARLRRIDWNEHYVPVRAFAVLDLISIRRVNAAQDRRQTVTQGGCFIATAAFGVDSDDVRVLRRFRDEALSTSNIGRLLVKMYVRTSPPIARVISTRPGLRAFARFLIAPFTVLARRYLRCPHDS